MIHGWACSADGTTPDLTIGAGGGTFTDGGGNYLYAEGGAMVKETDALWVAGTTNGGFPSSGVTIMTNRTCNPEEDWTRRPEVLTSGRRITNRPSCRFQPARSTGLGPARTNIKGIVATGHVLTSVSWPIPVRPAARPWETC